MAHQRQHGEFDIQLPKDFSDTDSEDSLLSTLDLVALIASSTVGLQEMKELHIPVDDLPPPGTPASSNATKTQRFVAVTNDDVKTYGALNQSKSTKKNTKWGIQILQDWHQEMYGEEMKLHDATVEELADKLSKFYCGAKPKYPNKRCEALPKLQAENYHKNTMKNIRAAINRHLQDVGRNVDIVHDAAFRRANKSLDGLLKERLKSGMSRPTQHKEIIDDIDLQKISTYFDDAALSAIKLRQCVWYQIAIHFVTRGLEFHHQLMLDSFEFKRDENGTEYVVMTHETQQKNFQGGLQKNEALSDKIMYATESSLSCPVKMLKLFIEKTDKNAKFLFNACTKDALRLHASEFLNTWYTSKPLGKSTFTHFLPDICTHAGCSKRYTAHCLRATSIQVLSDAGFEARQIMFMSGHRNEGSIRSYNRHCSSNQKQRLIETLSTVAFGLPLPSEQSTVPVPVLALPKPQPVRPQHTLPALAPPPTHQLISMPDTNADNDQQLFGLSSSPPRLGSCTVSSDASHTVSALSQVNRQSLQSTLMQGFLANSTFSNCTFNF